MSLYHAPTRPQPHMWARLWHLFVPPPPAEDPFVTLNLQVRLGVVANLLLRIENDERMFARGQRFIATKDAYDALLGDACRAAGVPPARSRTDDERLRVELELAARGWSW